MSEPATGVHVAADDTKPRGRWPLGTIVLALLSLAWLVAMLWLARAAVAAWAGSLAVSAAALVLPGVVAASLVGGAATGLLGTTLRRRPAGRVVRAGLGAGGGLVAGLLAGGLVLAAYGTGGPILVVAGTVALAGVLGGLAAALAPPAPVAAGLAGTLSAIGAGLVLEIARPVLKRLLGAGDTVASQVDATTRLTYLYSILVAVVAGLAAFRYLRRRRPDAQWPAFLLAGAAPGLLLLLSEVLTRAGGARLLEVAKALSPADRVSLDYLGAARLNHALIVLFGAAITAILLYGRTLPAPAADEPDAGGPRPAAERADAAGTPPEPDGSEPGAAGPRPEAAAAEPGAVPQPGAERPEPEAAAAEPEAVPEPGAERPEPEAAGSEPGPGAERSRQPAGHDGHGGG